MNNVEDTLKYKRLKIEAELKEAQEAAVQVKVWAGIAEQRGVNVLNHIRDIQELFEKLAKENYDVQELYEQLKRDGVAHGKK